MDFLRFKALYESCERCHAADQLELIETNLLVAAYGAGAKEAWDSLQPRLDLYRSLLNVEKAVPAQKGLLEYMKDHRRL